jgi:hypothetical protein
MAERRPFSIALGKMTLTMTLIIGSILLLFINLFRDTKGHLAPPFISCPFQVLL